MFDADPREGAHHRITYAWLCRESPLRDDLQAFANGTSRSQLSATSLRMIAMMRFIPTVETCVEALHRKVSLQSMTGLSPVRVSLANRLGLLESRIAADSAFVQQLVQCFSEARRFKNVAALMGFTRHPLLQGRVKSKSIVPILASIIYRCSLDDVFDDKADCAKFNTRERNKGIRNEAKLVNENKSGSPTVEEDVWRHALLLHVRAVADAASIYSVPGRMMAFERLSSYLDESETMAIARKRLRCADPSDMAVDVADDGLIDEDVVYFKFRHANPGDRHVQRASVGAGRTLRSTHVAITLHDHFPGAK